MGSMAHKLIYILKPFDFINVGQIQLFTLQHAFHMWATGNAEHVHTTLIK